MNCLARISLLLSVALLTGFAAALSVPQSAETLSGVKRIRLDWPETEPRAVAVRDHVLQKLKASNAVEIVTQPAEADAVLHGKSVIWVTGHVSQNPRSKSVEHAIYSGFASLEATSKNGQTLWSYLATPRVLTWKSLTDDLADQLVHEFLAALSAKRHAENSDASVLPGLNTRSAAVTLTGTGGTFPAPMYQKWFENFHLSHPEIQIQYAAVGSQEGAERFLTGQTDFGASDMPLRSEQLNRPHPRILQLATLAGAVVPIYNLPGAAAGLNLTPEVLAAIFLGKIERWNAPAICAINKHLRLPDEAIVVVHRSDRSGTTYALSEYLSKVSPEWKSQLGAAPTLAWPVGRGTEGNNGVATAVRKTPNSIGYVELLFALQHELDFAAVRNASGEYVKADVDSVTYAARTAEAAEQDGFAVSISNASGRHAYPIATFTWLLVPVESRDPAKLSALRALLRWILTTGQRQCQGLGYVPLPSEFAKKELQVLSSMH